MIAGVAMAMLSEMVDPKIVIDVSGAFDRLRRLAYWCVHHMSIFAHFESFRKGVFDQEDFFFFAAFTFLWLFLAVRALESRKWRY